MVIEWAVIEAVKQCSKFVECVFSNRLTIHKLIIKVRHSSVTMSKCTFLNFHFLYGSATRLSRGGEKYYIYFVDNLSLFPTVKEFSKSVNIWWSYCKNSTPSECCDVSQCRSRGWSSSQSVDVSSAQPAGPTTGSGPGTTRSGPRCGTW